MVPLKKERERDLLKQVESEYTIFNKTTYIGIEIEVENINESLPIYSGYWESKADNSLRNSGVEFISYPIKGSTISSLISLFYTYLPKQASFSNRTSIHIHVNCLDLTVEQITSFVLLYLFLERLLYRYIGRDRNKNIFCVPIQDTFRVSSLFLDLKSKLAFPLEYKIQDESARYSGLNLASLHEFGTLEFRQLFGTRNQKKVITWINLLLAIKEYASLRGPDKLINEISDLDTNEKYESYLKSIFGLLIKELPLDSLKKDIERGLHAIKYSTLSLNFKESLRRAYSRNSSAAMWQDTGITTTEWAFFFPPVDFVNETRL